MQQSNTDLVDALGPLAEGLSQFPDLPGLVELGQLDNEALHELLMQAVPLIRAECRDLGEINGQRAIWQALCPPVATCAENPQLAIEQLRAQRTVSISQPNPQPLSTVYDQLLLTGNVLLTVPLAETDLGAQGYEEALCASVTRAAAEPQLYWYDHPIPVGIAPENNEVLYGLKHLDQALAYEAERGNLPAGQQVDCVLSLSVTHAGLRTLARDYITGEINRHLELKHLRVFLFTEDDCQALLQELMPKQAEAIQPVFGVDGSYGRHYSFLKAIAAVWQHRVNPRLKATFKIDLDQVFVQPQLVEETGKSLFEHLRTPLWGAQAIDSNGHSLQLGMLAGALVNEADAEKGLFTPDVKLPGGPPRGVQQLMFKQLPQAVSTQAEMMTRYGAPQAPDGERSALQRIHVTGGTNGILVDSLMTYQPFTPSFVGRAEDQAFILSALNKGHSPGYLGYLHAAGLIMRHDKQAFAADAIQHAEIGTLIGDIERVLLFSFYARALPSTALDLTQHLAPFTGSFISPRPVALAILSFVYQGLLLAEEDDPRLQEYLHSGSRRLHNALQFCRDSLAKQVASERSAWHRFYGELAAAPAQQGTLLTLDRCLLSRNH